MIIPNDTSPKRGEYPPSRPADSPFRCVRCHHDFDRRVWHCPGCDHHWLIGDDECRNCHEFRREGPFAVYDGPPLIALTARELDAWDPEDDTSLPDVDNEGD